LSSLLHLNSYSKTSNSWCLSQSSHLDDPQC
jgi:hypothetical protein